MPAVKDPEGAKAYLMKHNLHTLFEELAAGVIASRPEDPLTFLETELARIVKERRPQQPATQEVKPADSKPAAAPAPAQDAKAAPAPAQDAKAAPAPAQDAKAAPAPAQDAKAAPAPAAH